MILLLFFLPLRNNIEQLIYLLYHEEDIRIRFRDYKYRLGLSK